MTEAELLSKLCNGNEPQCRFPLSAEEGSVLIVTELLSDLPQDRRDSIRRVIEEWSQELASSRAHSACESQSDGP